jgi:hypothetical protein
MWDYVDAHFSYFAWVALVLAWIGLSWGLGRVHRRKRERRAAAVQGFPVMPVQTVGDAVRSGSGRRPCLFGYRAGYGSRFMGAAARRANVAIAHAPLLRRRGPLRRQNPRYGGCALIRPVFDEFGVTLYHGDCREVLRSLPDKSINCCVTSPPYWGLRDYGTSLGMEPTPAEYVAEMVGLFSEVRRVLAEDGTLWLNLGDSYETKQLIGIPWRVAFALQADGWLLRSDIIWHKPNPMPESVTDRPTKAHEYVFLLAKNERYYYDAEAIRELKTKELCRGAAPQRQI